MVVRGGWLPMIVPLRFFVLMQQHTITTMTAITTSPPMTAPATMPLLNRRYKILTSLLSLETIK